jgi:hypothetical protein
LITGVAVFEFGAWFKLQRFVFESLDRLFGRGCFLFKFRKVGKFGKIRNARRVREQVEDRDLIPSGGRIRQIFLYQVIRFQFAAFFEQQDRCGSKLLCDRTQSKLRVGSIRYLPFEIRVTVAFVEYNGVFLWRSARFP